MVVIGSAGVLAPGKWRWLRALAWLAALCVAAVAMFNLVAKAALWLVAKADGIDLTGITVTRAINPISPSAPVRACAVPG